VRFAVTTEPQTLNFVHGSDRLSVMIGSLVSDTLVQYDASLRVVPRLAEAWELSPDGLTATFHLREGARWEDGAAVTAEDAVFTAERIRDPRSAATAKYDLFSPMVRIEAPNPRTVRVTYAERDPHAISAWTGAPLLPKHLWEKEADFLGSPLGRKPVGCGPFRLLEWLPGRELVFEASPTYWGGRPHLDRFIMKVIPEDATRLAALRLGEIDVLSMPPQQAADLAADPQASARLALLQTSALYLFYIGWNMDGSTPLFADERVRRALTLALDRPGYLASVFGSGYQPASTLIPPGCPAGDAGLTALPYDPAAAKSLLDEAGWKDADGDGVREQAGRRFSFTLLYPHTGQMNDQMAEFFQQNLAGVGVQMKLQKLEWSILLERMGRHRFEAFMAGMQFDPDAEPCGTFRSGAASDGSNYVSWKDAEVDRLCGQANAAQDEASRLALQREVGRLIGERLPITPILNPIGILAVDRRVHGVATSPLGFIQIAPGVAGWWVPREEQRFPSTHPPGS